MSELLCYLVWYAGAVWKGREGKGKGKGEGKGRRSRSGEGKFLCLGLIKLLCYQFGTLVQFGMEREGGIETWYAGAVWNGKGKGQ